LPDDRGLLPGACRDQGRHQLVVPAEDDRLQVGRHGWQLGRGVEAQEGVVADLPVTGEHAEGSGGEGLLDRGLQHLEDPETEWVVRPLALVQKVPDVEQDQSVDLGLLLEVSLQGLHPINENERVAIGDQLS
jgi:hypothetical protein